MKELALFITIAVFCLGAVAYAQSTAMPVQLGFMKTGCAGGYPCFQPYTAANPLPVSLSVMP